MPITIGLPPGCKRNLSKLKSITLKQGECFKIEG